LPIDKTSQHQLSYLLGIFRILINDHNRGLPGDFEIVNNIKSLNRYLKIYSREQYESINKNVRKYRFDSILKSYISATERVYYRSDILSKCLDSNEEWVGLFLKSLDILSGFLLFDDDFFDLEKDILNDKHSILIEYLLNGGNLKSAIKIMTNALSKCGVDAPEFEAYNELISGLIDVYIS
jgi:hypothetical protein